MPSDESIASDVTLEAESSVTAEAASPAEAERASTEATVLGNATVEAYAQRGYISDGYKGKGVTDQQDYHIEVLRPEFSDVESVKIFKTAMQGKPGYEVGEGSGYTYAKILLQAGELAPALLSRDEVEKALNNPALNLEQEEITSALASYDKSTVD